MQLDLVVVKSDSSSLLGRAWMQAFAALRIWLDKALIYAVKQYSGEPTQNSAEANLHLRK